MQYRKFGKSGWEVSALGLGTMGLPARGGRYPELDEAETVKIVRYLIESGVNYIDLGLPWGPVEPEPALCLLRQIMKNGYREKVRLALNIPAWSVAAAADLESYLDARLKWLGTDCIDYLILGSLDRETWPLLQSLGAQEWIEGAIAAGKARYPGFAFHDQYQFLKHIMKDYDRWALAQFQYSFMDIDHHPGASGLKYAADNGLGVVAAEPLRGGRLTRNLPAQVAALWAGRSPAKWGLKWAWNQTEVSTVLVDISSLEQAKEDVALVENALPESLSVDEEVLISRVRDAYRKLKAFPCTACRSCMPCPLGIDAPRIFELYNDAVMFNDAAISRDLHRFERHSIAACNECGSCVKLCGRGIDIPRQLRAAEEWLK